MANEFKIKNGYLSEGNSQITGSLNVSAGITGSLFGTSSYAIQALTASYVQTAQTASYVLSSSYATTASYVQNAQSASYVQNAQSASYVQNAQSASYVQNAQTASYVLNAVSASYATQAGNAATIDVNVFGSPVESYLLMSNVAGTTGVAIGGDADLRYNTSTNVLTVGNVSATTLTGSLLGTASYAAQALSSSYSVTASYYGGSVTSASYAVTASYVQNAQSASYVQTAQTASYVLNAVSASFATTASYLSGTIASASYAITASYVQNAQSASYVLNAVSSSYALSASYARTASYAQNIIISGSVNNVDYIDFNTSASTPSWKNGRIFFDNTEGALSVYNAEADITLQVGQENWTRVFNDTGVTIANGAAVRIIGTHGDHPEVVLAQSITTSGSSNIINQILGLATHTIEAGTFGYVTTQGLVRGLNTNAFVDGDTLYVSSSAGQLTSTPPLAPYEIIPIGQVVKASPGTSGIIYVAVQQPLDFSDLSSVQVQGTYSYGDLWSYQPTGSLGVWRHTNQLSGSYGVTGSWSSTSFTGSLLGTSSYAIQALSASYARTASYVQNAQSASYVLNAVSSSFASTASYLNTLNQNLTLNGNFTVNGTASYTYITASQLDVGTNFISVNVGEPAERFGGLIVYDSGSLSHLATASLAWDSLNNHWIYQNASGSTYSGGMLLAGPRNTGSLGDEQSLTRWFVARSDGGDHLNNTQIFSSGSIHIVTGSLTVTSGITGSLLGTASFATTASYYGGSVLSASYATTASYVQNAQTASYVLNAVSASYALSATTAQTASYVQTAQTASYVLSASYARTASYVQNAQTASYVQTAQTASYVQIAQTASYVLNAVSASYALNSTIANTASYVQNAQTASYVQTAQTASYVLNAISASYALNSTTAQTASYVQNAQTASYVQTAQTASYVLNAVSASYARTASYVQNAQTASYVLNAVSASYVTQALSSSFASTASYVNTLNQTVLITGSLTVGATSTGASENTITLGARDTANEGGQIGFNAPGGTYTSASFIDNWQNYIRILRGNNTTSDGLVTQWNLHTKQMQLPAYTNASSFVGTATANLAVDSGGNVITVSTTGGSVFPYVGNAVITGSLTTTGIIYAQPNGGMYFQGGDDAALYDINVANTMGIYGVQDVTVGAIKLGSNGPVLYGSGSRLGLGTTTPTSASLTVNGNVWANSFTGSLQGTSSYATQALSASYALSATTANTASYVQNAQTASYVQTAQTASYVLNAISSSYALSASFSVSSSRAVSASFATTASYYGGSVISASYAATASYVNPLIQNVIVTGSLDISGSFIAYDESNVKAIQANLSKRSLFDTSAVVSVNWSGRGLYTPSSILAIDWSDNNYLDSNVYQRDYKSATTQNAVSNTINNAYSSYLGDIIEVDGVNTIINGTVNDGMLVYLDTDATWYPVNQSSTTATKMIGIACNVAGPTGFILLEGHVVIDDSGANRPTVTGADHGLPVYIEDSTTNGRMSTTLPTTAGGNNVIRVVGHCYWNNTGTSSQWMMKFRPSNDWITI
jgi:hypothetical protein